MITTNTYRVIFKSQISCQGFCMHVYQHGNLFSRIIIIPTLQIKKLSGKKKKKLSGKCQPSHSLSLLFTTS